MMLFQIAEMATCRKWSSHGPAFLFCVYIYMFVCMCVYIYIYVCVCVCVCYYYEKNSFAVLKWSKIFIISSPINIVVCILGLFFSL
jgi:uncharacterized membrane protein YesL